MREEGKETERTEEKERGRTKGKPRQDRRSEGSIERKIHCPQQRSLL